MRLLKDLLNRVSPQSLNGASNSKCQGYRFFIRKHMILFTVLNRITFSWPISNKCKEIFTQNLKALRWSPNLVLAINICHIRQNVFWQIMLTVFNSLIQDIFPIERHYCMGKKGSNKPHAWEKELLVRYPLSTELQELYPMLQDPQVTPIII